MPAVTLGTGDFLAPGPIWDETRNAFRARGLDDVYFDHRYAGLYRGKDGSVRAFSYRCGGDFFFMPFVCRPIPGSTGLRDFETPYGYGGPVATTEDPSFLDGAWAEFAAMAAADGLIAGFVRFHPLLATERFAREPFVRVRRDRETVSLALNREYEAVAAEYADDNRWRIRKGGRLGVTVEAKTGGDSLLLLAELYRDRMDELDADKFYFFDDAYFAHLADLGQDAYRVYVASLDGEAIGATVILFGDRFCHYHLSGSRKEHFKVGPYNMLLDRVIRDSLGGRWTDLHLGGGRTADSADSLLRFKRAFSNKVTWFHNGAVVLSPAAYGDVCGDWRRAHPDKADRFGGRVLMYRY